jgi:hypothetical protein
MYVLCCAVMKKHVSKCRLELYIPVNLQTRNWGSMVSVLTAFLLYGQLSDTFSLSLSLFLWGFWKMWDVAVDSVLD